MYPDTIDGVPMTHEQLQQANAEHDIAQHDTHEKDFYFAVLEMVFHAQPGSGVAAACAEAKVALDERRKIFKRPKPYKAPKKTAKINPNKSYPKPNLVAPPGAVTRIDGPLDFQDLTKIS